MAATKRRIVRTPRIDLVAAVKDYLLNRSMRERSEYHEGTIKKQLMAELEHRGEREENKDTLVLETPLTFQSYKDGKPKEKKIVGIERRARTSQSLNEERTMALLDRKDMVAQCTETVTIINEDAVLAANYRGDITDAELAKLYDENTTYAFWLTEG
jgi:hypothetical protein